MNNKKTIQHLLNIKDISDILLPNINLTHEQFLLLAYNIKSYDDLFKNNYYDYFFENSKFKILKRLINICFIVYKTDILIDKKRMAKLIFDLSEKYINLDIDQNTIIKYINDYYSQSNYKKLYFFKFISNKSK